MGQGVCGLHSPCVSCNTFQQEGHTRWYVGVFCSVASSAMEGIAGVPLLSDSDAALFIRQRLWSAECVGRSRTGSCTFQIPYHHIPQLLAVMVCTDHLKSHLLMRF